MPFIFTKYVQVQKATPHKGSKLYNWKLQLQSCTVQKIVFIATLKAYFTIVALLKYWPQLSQKCILQKYITGAFLTIINLNI